LLTYTKNVNYSQHFWLSEIQKNHLTPRVLERPSRFLSIVALLEMNDFRIMKCGFKSTEDAFARVGQRISKRSGEGQKGAPETPFLYYFMIRCAPSFFAETCCYCVFGSNQQQFCSPVINWLGDSRFLLKHLVAFKNLSCEISVDPLILKYSQLSLYSGYSQ
jgi:hypothetical protein